MLPPSMIRFVAFGAAAAVLVAACSSSSDNSAQPMDPAQPTTSAGQPPAEPTPRPSPTVEPDPPGRATIPEDLLLEPGPRLAVQSADGQISTMLGDGSNVVPLTDAAEGRANTGPVWSRDSNRLGWVASDPVGGDISVRTARFDGSAWGDVAVESAPFLMSWDPTSSQIAALSDARGVFELGVIAVDEDPRYQSIDEGAPFWFSWNPDADGFLVHASNLRLDLVPIEGTSQVLAPEPGDFQAPRWLEGAVELVYADQVGAEQFLVVTGGQGKGRRALVTYDGYLQFSVAPESGLIALHVIDPSLAPQYDVITASYSQPDRFVDVIDDIPRNELTLMAVFGGDPFVLHPAPGDLDPNRVVSFHWSPDGSTLAWLLELDPGDGDCASETAVYALQFWTNSGFVDGPGFRPSATLACDYIPIFDQLEQSVSFWSPDGLIFTYAGIDAFTEERGIWNFEVVPGAIPEFVAKGEIGVWSPDVPGSVAQSAL
ncbi:MAG: TolB family protein [Acidimicrobiales bacterium]